MMKIRRQYFRFGILGALVVLGWALFTVWGTWRTGAILVRAQQEIADGRLDAARSRLASLASRPGTKGGAADYWLGICEAIDGRADEAMRAFRPGARELSHSNLEAHTSRPRRTWLLAACVPRNGVSRQPWLAAGLG